MSQLLMAPFTEFIGRIFEFIIAAVGNPGMSLIILSIIVNIILFPLYHFADGIEKKEKHIQEVMKPKIDEFKSVYKGYELHLYINNVYRMNKYHPAYSLRGLVSLVIQIPFFMGAYAYLTSYTGFQGVSFLFLSNLAQPDGLLQFGKVVINIMPFVMTGINLLTGYIYAKDMTKSEKFTIVAIALFFLVVLYNSPSSLLLYWTFNNIFSLVKTYVYYKIDNSKKEMELVSHAN